MSKIFRIHNRAVNGESDWFNSNQLNEQDLNTIAAQNQNGKIATSIPSPFARFELVKAAFRSIERSGNLNGDTNNHKLISDALDVGQLFYYFHEIKNRQGIHCEIVAWNPNSHIEELKNRAASRIYGNTLELFWNRDGNAYGYNRINRIFILKINHIVVGATSPSNLFIAAPDVSTLNFDFQFGNVRLFDDHYESLAERDSDFIKYIFALRKQNNFNENFREFDLYLTLVDEYLRKNNNSLWAEINSNQINFERDYRVIEMSPGNPVEVMGLQLRCNQPRTDLIPRISDFLIECSQGYPLVPINIPLVLPTSPGYGNWKYTDRANWNENIKVPEIDQRKLSERILPGQADQYPYLTIGDFLEENIYVLPNGTELNVDKFHLFEDNASYLIPLKPEIFKYISIEDLVGKKMLNISDRTFNSVRTIEVTLSIPARRDRIIYKKTYKNINQKKEEYYGNIVDFDFQLGLFPLIKDNRNNNINYHIGTINRNLNENYSLCFYDRNVKIEQNSVNRIRMEYGNGQSIHYKVQKPFDFVRIVNDKNIGGLIIPKFSNVILNNDQVNVAIDFGTSNTHIEVQRGNGNPRGLEIDGIYSSFIKNCSEALQIQGERLLKMELLPESVGKMDSVCKFPLNTALISNNNTNWYVDVIPFLDTNVAYFFGKVKNQSHHEIFTNLKWGNLNNEIEKKKLENYLEGILEAIKYKLIADGILLNNISITWMYPVSMTTFQLGSFKRIWNDLGQRIFGDNIKINALTESIAPFQLYSETRNTYGVTATIDIGGGTSDIAIFVNEKELKLISSINFAGNAIYGDGFNNNIKSNGFYKQYKSEFKTYCEHNDSSNELIDVFEDIVKDNPHSAVLCNFLYSIEKFNFGDRLARNQDLKLLFVLFYAIQAYYLANLFRKLNLQIPENIIFSGTGSKSINIIDPSPSKVAIRKLFQFFFKEVFKDNLNSSEIKNIEIADFPKEVSCQGALLDVPDLKRGLEDKIGYWCGRDDKEITLTSGSSITYSEAIKPDFITKVINSIKEFYSIFDLYSHSINLSDTFGINYEAEEKFREIRDQNLEQFLNAGIQRKMENDKRNEKAHLTEGILFYAFVGLLNRLGSKLSE